MQLVQARIVTGDVARLARFYSELLDVPTVLNDYYVEILSGAVTVGFSKRQFTEYGCADRVGQGQGTIILDFLVDDVDEHLARIDALGVEWVLPPTDQPWGTRSMLLRDPEGNLINVFSRKEQGEP